MPSNDLGRRCCPELQVSSGVLSSPLTILEGLHRSLCGGTRTLNTRHSDGNFSFTFKKYSKVLCKK